MLTLGIESSCDDLSMALLQNGRAIETVTSSQIREHEIYGGVVPEIASRRHLELLESTLDLLLDKTQIRLSQIEAVAATHAPGLIGSLLVGLNFGKSLAWALQKPFRGIHHIEGHLWSVGLEHELKLPYLGLAVSGGHSHLYLIEDLGRYRLLGKTVDDAAGEAFDKVAKIMGLPYPGGPSIDKISSQGNPKAFAFAVPQVKRNPLWTSFSGMKTLAADYWKEHSASLPLEKLQADLAASFQRGVVEALIKMIERSWRTLKEEDITVQQLAVVGGVACNRLLRTRMQEFSEKIKTPFIAPSPKFCTDNAAMIAWVGEKYLERGEASLWSLNAEARKEIG